MCEYYCSLANRFQTTRKLNSLLKDDEPAALAKRVSVNPRKYQDNSDDSTDRDSDSDSVIEIQGDIYLLLAIL